ncbi:transporter substrate-binding domain-containing protein [Streptomyces sp. NPDC020807]|uniref:transporter substrate-binding domain-containing protein n=1 Tax=Streptomyces sp. NPDC020807 TaxID=3155119 RepID=UPI0033DD95C8
MSVTHKAGRRSLGLRLGALVLPALLAAGCATTGGTGTGTGTDPLPPSQSQPAPTPAPLDPSDRPILVPGQTIRLGMKSDQPGTGFMLHAKQFNGYDLVIANQLVTLAGLNSASVKPQPVGSKDRAPDLQNNQVDLVAATYSITAKRTMARPAGDGLDFVGPYATTYQGVLVRAEDKDRYRTLADLDYKQVCVWGETTSKTELDRPAYEKIRQLPLTDAGECVRALKDGVVDAVSTDRLILYGFAHSDPSVVVVPKIKIGDPNQYGVAMLRTPQHKKDCERLREALKQYLSGNDWDSDIRRSLPSLPEEDLVTARPKVSEVEALSCRERPGNAAGN